MKSKYPYMSYVTVDAIIYRVSPTEPHRTEVLLIKRKNEPFKGKWALPGGYMEPHEIPEQTVFREVFEETGIAGNGFVPFRGYAGPNRDPRGFTSTFPFSLDFDKMINKTIKVGDDATEYKWEHLTYGMDLAFDHAEIVGDFYVDEIADKEIERALDNLREDDNRYILKLGEDILVFPGDNYLFEYLNITLNYPPNYDQVLLDLSILEENKENFLVRNSEVYLFTELTESFMNYLDI